MRLQDGAYIDDTTTGYRLNESIPTAFTVWRDTAVSPTTYRAESNLYGVDDISGSSADTVIESACDALTSGRTWKEKVVCKGFFPVTDSIRVPSYTTLDLTNAHLQAQAGFTADAGILRNADETATNIDVIGGILDGNDATVGGNGAFGVAFGRLGTTDTASDVRFINVTAKDCGRHGFGLRPYAFNIWFINCKSVDNQLNGFDIMGASDSPYTLSTYNVWCTDCHATGNQYAGFDISSSATRIFLTNPVCTGNNQANYSNDAAIVTSSLSRYVHITNPQLYDNGLTAAAATDGIRISDSAETFIVGGRIYSTSTVTGRDGVRIWNAGKASITGLTVDNMANGINSFYSTAAVTQATVEACKISNTTYAVLLYGATDSIYKGNVISDSTWGFYETNAVGGTTDYNTYMGNNIRDTVTTPFTIVGTHTNTDIHGASPSSLDLSGAGTDLNVWHAPRTAVLLGYTLQYTEASSADAGVSVDIGRYQDGVALDDDYFDTSTSEQSKNLGYSKTFVTADLTNKAISAGDSVTVGTAGGKAGTGEVRVFLKIAYV